MATVEYGPDVNLKELRGQLADRVAWTLIGVGAALVLLTWPLVAFWPLGGVPAFVVPLAIGLVALGWSGRALAAARPSLARHLLLWGLAGGLLTAMGLSSEIWLPFLGLTLIPIASLLVSGGGFATAGLVAAVAVGATLKGARVYPLIPLFIALVLATVLAWQAAHILYTALGWAWTMQQRADRLLGEARDRQVRLANANRSVPEFL